MHEPFLDPAIDSPLCDASPVSRIPRRKHSDFISAGGAHLRLQPGGSSYNQDLVFFAGSYDFSVFAAHPDAFIGIATSVGVDYNEPG